MSGNDHRSRTRYGFIWGNAEVLCVCSDERVRVIDLVTPRETLTIHVTPSGLIRTRVAKRKREKLG